ncbi:hypothetical protein [Psychromonas sp. SA13A]|uniref:hypothetical protein n=1 Tax=Psychromonas sp. SA13A TaxID=2686346 RepID=UPI00140B063C|nr:hypothetical protein [Psychromonas sp. SA13A]
MAKYIKGETSSEVIENKEKITNSIINKTKILNQSIKDKVLPYGLSLNKYNNVTLGNVCKWECEELYVYKYAYTTGNSSTNSDYTEDLKKAIMNINQAIVKNEINDQSKLESNEQPSRKETKKSLKAKNLRLSIELQEVKNNVVEVYRGYCQLKQFIENNDFDNDTYHKLLRKQSSIINKKRLKVIK